MSIVRPDAALHPRQPEAGTGNPDLTARPDQIALAVSETISRWSRQEHDLASELAQLLTRPEHTTDLPGSLEERLQPDPAGGSGIASSAAPGAVESPAPTGTGPEPDLDLDNCSSDDGWVLVSPLASLDREESGELRRGAFDDLLGAVSGTIPDRSLTGPLPEPRRFMVRVARVGQPVRTTKRNYNYFDELQARLADLAHEERTHPT